VAPSASSGLPFGAGTLANSGPSRFGPLGYFVQLGYYENGVQLTFRASAVAGGYRNLTPRQWSGPEATYTRDQVLTGSWKTLLSDSGSGADDPLPQVQSVTPSEVTYYDAPGVSVMPILRADPNVRRVHAVQNFTGWVEGVPAGGGPAQRLSETLAWHSVVSVAQTSADPAKPDFQQTGATNSGVGWVGTGPPAV
jgi:hypothetical protein